jgi:bilirubin oxidase
MIISS